MLLKRKSRKYMIEIYGRGNITFLCPNCQTVQNTVIILYNLMNSNLLQISLVKSPVSALLLAPQNPYIPLSSFSLPDILLCFVCKF